MAKMKSCDGKDKKDQVIRKRGVLPGHQTTRVGVEWTADVVYMQQVHI